MRRSQRSKPDVSFEALESQLVWRASHTVPRHLFGVISDSNTASLLADSLAIGIAGARSPFRDPLLNVVRSWGASGTCRILASEARLPAPSSAFMNAFQMHCLEYDAVHEAAVAHVATAPVAALLAEIDQADAPVPGDKLLTALVVGIEVAATLGVAARSKIAFFRPATTGVFGAAAAVASIRGYDEHMVRQTFGYALSSAAGTMQAHEEGMPTLPIQLASAARAGIVAADLAASGIPTIAHGISGKFGYLAMFESEVRVDKDMLEGIALPWKVGEMSLKPFPSGRATHGGIEATLEARSRGVNAKTLESAVLHAPPLIDQLVNRPAKPDMNVNYARLSFPYVAAVALQDGGVTLADFSPERMAREDTRILAERIRIVVDDNPDPAAFTPQRLSVTCNDGSEHIIAVEHLLGSPVHRMRRDQHKQKIAECLEGVDVDAEQLLAAVGELVNSADSKQLLQPSLYQ